MRPVYCLAFLALAIFSGGCDQLNDTGVKTSTTSSAPICGPGTVLYENQCRPGGVCGPGTRYEAGQCVVDLSATTSKTPTPQPSSTITNDQENNDPPPSASGTTSDKAKGDSPAKPGVTPGAPSVTGQLSMDVIRRVLRRYNAQFKFCYESALMKNPNLKGAVRVKFVIDRNGDVSSAVDAGSDIGDASVVSCVVARFRTMKFPAPESGIVTVTYPIQFAPAN